MKSNELKLMAGDWVLRNDVEFKVSPTTLLTLDVNPAFANIKPIKLTPEIMERIEGVVKVGTGGYYITDDIVLWERDNGFFYDERCTITYLHQLQQLIRLFTGKEIEVKWEK